MPELAFVVPAYNEEALIGRCLESILRAIEATGCRAEVVVVNNASTDRTREIASSFPKVRVVDEPVKGLVQARHAGLMASSAELVANVDADTILPEGWITTVLKSFATDKNLVALSGPFVFYDLSPYRRALVQLYYYAAFLFYLVNRHVLRIGSVVQGGNFVFRRSVWLEIGGYDRTISFYGEDTDVARRLTRVGAVRWTFALPMYASGRRLKAEGMLRSAFRYAANYVWMTFAGRPFTFEYTDIRPAAGVGPPRQPRALRARSGRWLP
jgi:glycosyltransferase involved in cell wall biosynthesis